MPRRGPTIADLVLGHIHARGPQTIAELATVMVSAGATRAKDPQQAVRAAIDYHSALLPDDVGRWYSLADQLEGAIFTRRPTSLELRDQIILMVEDLWLVEQLVGRRRRSGDEDGPHLDMVSDFFDLPWIDVHPDEDDTDDVRAWPIDADLAVELLGLVRELGVPYDVPDDEALAEFLEDTRYGYVLHGPAGWIPPIRADGLVGITISGGALHTVALDRRDVRGPQVALAGARIRSLAHRTIGPDPSWFGPSVIPLRELLERVATDAPEILRRPLPPLTEVLGRAGLEVVDGMVGHAGTAWGRFSPIDDERVQKAWGYVPPDRPV